MREGGREGRRECIGRRRRRILVLLEPKRFESASEGKS
jgi:hypothetical protein